MNADRSGSTTQMGAENTKTAGISMQEAKVLPRHLVFVALMLFLCLSGGGAFAQSGAQEQKPAASQPQTAPTESSAGNPKGPQTAASDQHPDNHSQTPQPPGETRISPQEAEELFRSVDQIIKFSSQDTGLPVLHPVKRQLISRDQLTAYLEKHMEEDKDAQRLKRSELVLKKFGLLPRDFDLHSFLIALLREQVAGYYDVETQTVNLLDWVDVEQQKPVLAHELTHALQDQSFHLERWMKVGETDLALSKDNPTPQDIERDEAQTVRQAVVEGQAMAVLVDYMLAPTGQSLTTSPQIVEALKAGMLVGTADSVHFQNAPIFLKEILTFPYRYGLDFVSDVLTRDGKEKAFAGILAKPPHTTREIMEPKTYLASERIDPLPLPDFLHLMKDYQKFDVGSMGEFDVALLLDEYAGPDTSKALYPDWRGGYYYATRPKADPAAPLAIVYVSRWASAVSAQKFAAIYADSLKKRYRSLRAVSISADQRPPAAKTVSASEDREWLTEEGDVVIDAQGASVFITESVDDVTSGRLRDAVLNRGNTSRLQGQGQPQRTSFDFAPSFSSALRSRQAQECQGTQCDATLTSLSAPVSSAVSAFSLALPPSRPAESGRQSPSR
jgi:hypothetical protein